VGGTTIDPAAGLSEASSDRTWRRYGEYLRRPPVLTLEWADTETDARGWLVINSLRGGASGGGTRMHVGLTRREVTYLAKTMELKFAFSGPPIGGAKSGIDFEPADPRRTGVLRRWFQAIAPQLQRCYGTGGDLNVDELVDVIPGCAAIGLSHPQEGIVRGHLHPDEERLARILEALDVGVRAEVCPPIGMAGARLQVADMVTGYGLARAVVRLHAEQGRDVRGARVLLEGFGTVGGPCALHLARAGARIVGICDHEKALVEPAGLDDTAIEDLLLARKEKLIPRDDPRCAWGRDRFRFWELGADVFVSAAASGMIDEKVLGRLHARGVRVIACGANQPFRERKLGATRVQRLADRHFLVIPDVIANSGMARAFSYLMGDVAATDPVSLFRAVDETISDALHEIVARTGDQPNGLLAATLAYALDRVHHA
jgi:glutamate dehydrogenase/leucine dehydrogenase